MSACWAALLLQLPQSKHLLPDMQPQFHGMVPVAGGQFGKLQHDSNQWSNSLKQCASVCNSLTLVNRMSLVGDAADYSAFKLCEATFVV